MVRLKVCFPTKWTELEADFNSNMVRLKAFIFDTADTGKAWFQFQYGAIKSKYHRHNADQQSQFQFQYGAIKRCNIPFLKIFISDFNSNMVRLKAWLGSTLCFRKVHFNSNMVRLKERTEVCRY